MISIRAANTMNAHGGHEYSRYFIDEIRLGKSKPRLVRENTVSVERGLMIILPILWIAVEQNRRKTTIRDHTSAAFGNIIQNHIVSPLVFRGNSGRIPEDRRRKPRRRMERAPHASPTLYFRVTRADGIVPDVTRTAIRSHYRRNNRKRITQKTRDVFPFAASVPFSIKPKSNCSAGGSVRRVLSFHLITAKHGRTRWHRNIRYGPVTRQVGGRRDVRETARDTDGETIVYDGSRSVIGGHKTKTDSVTVQTDGFA